MPLPRLFCPDLNPGSVTLPPEEARHAVTVLRAAVGDDMELFDGNGGQAGGVITHVGERGLVVEVRQVERRPFELLRRITLAVAMPKTHRQGYLVEKCTELGVAAIWPIITERSVTRPRPAALEKWSRRAVEAAKQSGRSWLPTFTNPQPFRETLARIGEFDAAGMTEVGFGLPLFASFLAARPDASSLLVWVGPEGGWSDAERKQAVGAGAVLTGLGPNVLRTETAAVAVCAAAAMIGDGGLTQGSVI